MLAHNREGVSLFFELQKTVVLFRLLQARLAERKGALRLVTYKLCSSPFRAKNDVHLAIRPFFEALEVKLHLGAVALYLNPRFSNMRSGYST